MSLDDARRLVSRAEAIVIAAGAGMGVDSGLPDFRGPEGFWKAYPPYKKLGLDFMALANPRWFESDPALAWGFYGHRLHLYRDTVPHAGFADLLALAATKKHGAFVFTSNIDGQFQKAGFDRVVEVHGSIHHLQCCGIFTAKDVRVTIDPESMRALPPLPKCPSCGKLARPNVLMFGDWGWDGERTDAQIAALQAWLDETSGVPRVVIECGAGTGVPTVRSFSERLHAGGTTPIRVNVREPEVPRRAFGFSLGAEEAIAALVR